MFYFGRTVRVGPFTAEEVFLEDLDHGLQIIQAQDEVLSLPW